MPTKRARYAGYLARKRLGPAPAKRVTKRRKTVPARNRGKLTRGTNYTFSRYYSDTDQILVTSPAYYGSKEFTFAQLTNPTDFSNLFDQYRIKMVVLKLYLINVPENPLYVGDASAQNVNAATSYINNVNTYPKLWYVSDSDDSSAPGSINAMKEIQGVKCRVLNPRKPVTIILRPGILTPAYKAGATWGYSLSKGRWVDMANTDVPHYGLKYAIEAQNTEVSVNFPYKLRWETKIYFNCKGAQ